MGRAGPYCVLDSEADLYVAEGQVRVHVERVLPHADHFPSYASDKYS